MHVNIKNSIFHEEKLSARDATVRLTDSCTDDDFKSLSP
jgi:hypothetical protein